MKLKDLLNFIHEEQIIELYYLSSLVFKGFKTEYIDDDYLNMDIKQIWSGEEDNLEIYIK